METCPLCKSTDIWGCELTGIYDGIIYWECQSCLAKIHRFQNKQISNIETIKEYDEVKFTFVDNTTCINLGEWEKGTVQGLLI